MNIQTAYDRNCESRRQQPLYHAVATRGHLQCGRSLEDKRKDEQNVGAKMLRFCFLKRLLSGCYVVFERKPCGELGLPAGFLGRLSHGRTVM